MKCVGRLATKTWGRKAPPHFFFESIFKKIQHKFGYVEYIRICIVSGATCFRKMYTIKNNSIKKKV